MEVALRGLRRRIAALEQQRERLLSKLEG
jgi:hypothetical protein